MSGERDRGLDVVLFGATGFIGRLTARYLAENAPEAARIGLAGRSAERLAAVRQGLGPKASHWPLLLADAHDERSMTDLAHATAVLMTTVGPYGRYGLTPAAACAKAGTDYADLTGEVLFVREVIDRFEGVASMNGARLVHACGFDSIPSDLGVLLLAERARAAGVDLLDTTLVVTAMEGGVSGGTVDSMRRQLELVAEEPGLARILADPYALSPDRSAEPDFGQQPDGPRFIARDRELGGWIGPFLMAPFNTRVVRRSNALQGWSYGRGFRYREVRGYGSSLPAGAKAAAGSLGMGLVQTGLRVPSVRDAIFRALPSPGEGPSDESRRRGHFRMEIHARTTSGARYVGVVAAHRDPGYGGTAVMLGEAGLCLALDTHELPGRAGVLTPATAMGTALTRRLRGAGFEFSVECTDQDQAEQGL